MVCALTEESAHHATNKRAVHELGHGCRLSAAGPPFVTALHEEYGLDCAPRHREGVEAELKSVVERPYG
jgi:hypothetical protein